MVKVVNRRYTYPLTGDVYIGRPGPFGNPFVIGRDGTREQVIEKFSFYLHENPDIAFELWKLKPKRLVCFCAPEACHGDVYAEALEGWGFEERGVVGDD